MSNPLELTPARVFALIAHYYPGIVGRFLDGLLTDKQVEMLLSEVHFIRFMEDQQGLRYAFSKFGEDDRKKMLQPAPPDPDAARAWAEFAYRPYGLLEDLEGESIQAIPGMTPETALAICEWWKRGDCPDDVWASTVIHWHRQIIATAPAEKG